MLKISEKTLNLLYIILIISISLMVFVSIFIAIPYGDEINYHYPNANYLSIERIIQPDSKYSSAYTPLPYLLGNIVLSIKSSITSLRILNYLIFLLFILYSYLISKNISTHSLILTLLVISNPYLLRSAFTYYLFSYGITFSLIGIYFYFFYKGKLRYLLAHIFWGLAVLSQQWMLIIIFAILFLEIYHCSFEKASLIKISKGILLKFLVLLPSLYLFISWKGLTHPNFKAHTLHPTFEHLNAVLSNFGFLVFFISLFSFKEYLMKKELVPVLFILPILFLTIPTHSAHHGAEVITGLTAQLATQIEKFSFISYTIVIFIFVIFGLNLIIISIIKHKDKFEYFLFLVILLFATSFTSSTLLGASHIFVSAPFIIIFFNKDITKHNYTRYLMSIQFYLVAVFYILYWSLFVTYGKSF